LEVVLGIDNIVVLSILTQSLPAKEAQRARAIGLGLALAMRLALLFAISWITHLTYPVFSAGGQDFSWRDLILIGGGLFLMVKATQEIHAEIEGSHHSASTDRPKASFRAIISQIVLMDLVFSLDSIIMAVGLARDIEVMVAAICISIGIMFLAARPVGEFVKRHPTTKMLALCFLILIGVALVADGFGLHIPRGYIYFAMAFSGIVEAFNIWAKGSSRLHRAYVGGSERGERLELANHPVTPPAPKASQAEKGDITPRPKTPMRAQRRKNRKR
jgi:predicted tellurium resistance membrane protein TerC